METRSAQPTAAWGDVGRVLLKGDGAVGVAGDP